MSNYEGTLAAGQRLEREPVIQDDFHRLEEFAKKYAEGQAALEELEIAKQVLAFAISKLPKQQLKLTVTEQANLHTLALQQKLEGKSGAILFRAVKS